MTTALLSVSESLYKDLKRTGHKEKPSVCEKNQLHPIAPERLCSFHLYLKTSLHLSHLYSILSGLSVYTAK